MNQRVKGGATAQREMGPTGAIAADAAGVPGRSAVTIAPGALPAIERAVIALQEIKRLNDAMQQQYATGSAAWHQCETIDDRVHDALGALGE